METNTTPTTNTTDAAHLPAPAADGALVTAELTQEREQLAWKLRIKGWNQERIAQHLGIDQATVSRMLKRARTRLAAEYTAEKIEMIAEQADRLLHIVNEALDAWEASKQQPETAPAEPQALLPPRPQPQAAPPACPQSPSTTENPPTNTGRPAYLRIALQALKALQNLTTLRRDAAEASEEFQSLPCPTKTLIGIDMERFRNGLGDPADDPQIQPANA